MEQLEDRSLPSSYTAASVSELIADVNAANLTSEADTITLVAGKTFTLNAVDNTTHGATGLPTIAATENLTILGNGDSIERSTAAGTPAFRLFDVAAGASLTLQDLTLQGGLAFGYGYQAQGGAVYNQGTLSLDGVTVQGNTAQGYDGIDHSYFLAGSSAAGGGLYSNGVLTMKGCTVQNNVASGGRGANGYFYHPLCDGGSCPTTIKVPGGAGGTGLGGGLHVGGGTATISTTTVTTNTAQGGAGGKWGSNGQGFGGGLYIDNSLASVGLDAFTVSHVSRNKASSSNSDIYGSYNVIP